MTDRSALSVTQSRGVANFSIFLAGNALSFGAMWGQRVVTGWLIWQLTGSLIWLAATATVELASALIVTPLAGIWLDRHNRHSVLTYGQAAATILSGALALVATFNALTSPLLAALTAASGCAGAVYLPARLALLSDVDGVPGPQRANSFMALASQFGAFIIPAAIGVVLAVHGAAISFMVLCMLNALATMTTLAIATRRAPLDPVNAQSGTVDWWAARNYLTTSNAGIPQILIVFMIAVIAGRGVTDLLPGYVDIVLAGDVVVLSRLTASIGVGALLTSLTLLAIGKCDTLRQVRVSLLLAIAGVAGLAASSDPTIATASVGILGAGLSLNTTATQTHLLDNIPPAFRGRFSALFALIWRGGPILGVAATASIAYWFSMAEIGIFAMGLLVLALLVTLRR